MIKRIKEIKGVGPFSNFVNGGQFQFEKLTLIFGLNTYGKSTLADIFRSIKENNTEIIEKRKTIGVDSQKIEVNFFSSGTQSEQSIKFNNGQWQNINNFPYKLEIFDTKFIEKNVFTGLSITRENKEQLTDFILGESSVEIALEIQRLKKERDEKNKELKKIEKSIENKLREKELDIDLKKFCAISVEEDKKELKQKIQTLTEKQQEIIENKSKLKQILDLKKPRILNFNLTFEEKFKLANEILNKDFEGLNKELFEKITNHIEENFKHKDNNEENWLREGLNYITDFNKDNCPFCGQPLANSDLISVYQKYFSEEYKKFIRDVTNRLDKLYEEIIQINGNLIIKQLYKEKEIVNKANVFIKDDEFLKLNETLNELINEIGKDIKTLESILQQLITELKEKKDKKQKIPYLSIEIIDISNLEKIENKIEDNLKKFNGNLKRCSAIIKDFKGKYSNSTKIDNKLKEINSQLKDLNIKYTRKNLSAECSKWRSLKDELNELQQDIEEKQRELEEQQNTFIEEYFEKVNNIFKSLGSYNFQINKKIERRGHKNVISLEIKIQDKPVEYKDIEFVFSDSDRRALAFSIFLARLENLQNFELEKTIVILDDPVVSFDDNRIRVTISKIKEVQRKAKQVIVFSHYDKFLQKLIGNINDNYSLLKIEKLDSTSQLVKIESSDFLLDEHEKMFLKIRDFIERKITDLDSKNLRLFFENEIKIRYRMQLYQHDLTKKQLKDIINGLSENNIITEEVKNKMHNFREQLNPEHHSYIGNSYNVEDIRNLANELLEFLYGGLG